MNKEIQPLPSNESQQVSKNSSSEVLKRAEEVWGKAFASVAELFETKNTFDSQVVKVYPHMIGHKEGELRLIPYDNVFGIKQESLSAQLAQGEIAISIKHHSPSPMPNKLDDLKLQCTHIQMAVRVRDGVLTINNPRGYEGGLFGEPDYPMILLRPKFPSYITSEMQKAYIDNIRTWLVIANTFSQFPGDYDGGDPLGCIDKERILKYGKALLQALMGDQSAKDWLDKDENRLYCAELAYVALNLGIHFPLNERFIGADFSLIQKHIVEKAFLTENENPYVALVDLVMAPNNLDPIAILNGKELAIEPFCSADIIYHYIQNIVPRQHLGEVLGSELQSKVFDEIKPMLPNFLRLETTLEKEQFHILVQKIGQVIAGIYPNYLDFKLALKPILDELRVFSQKYGMAYIPPHCFLIRALENSLKKTNAGFFEWEYVGHGLHSIILKG